MAYHVQEPGRRAVGTEVGSTCLAARTDDELRSLLLQGLDKTVHLLLLMPPPHSLTCAP